ncbi:MAG: sulfatase [Prolixibacteraceae bacterium]|nr:sulfatase [Prolixibacteraceae bacterium]
MKNLKQQISRFTFSSSLLILVFLSAVACTSEQTSDNTAKPNVLFIAIDDLRPELACYGATQLKTPNIDQLASEAMIFNRAYCNVPVCGASRASLMTGILPTKDRFVSHLSRADEDVPGAKTLPQIFKEAGYTTISNGKVFHTKADNDSVSWSETAWGSGMSHSTNLDEASTEILSERGRGRMFEMPDVGDYEYPDGKVALKTIEDLKRLKDADQPFFLACGFIRPHMPFYAPKKYWDMYERDEIELAPNRFEIENKPSKLKTSGEFRSYHFGGYEEGTEAFHRMMRHGYFACTSYADKLAGDVLNELEELGLAENTIVVLWGDHGWHLGEHEFWGKHNTLHNALRIPFIVKIPGETNGDKTEAIIQSVDIFPTLCKLAGLPIPKTLQGKSFVSIMDDPAQSFNDVIYTRFKSMDAVVEKVFAYTLFDNGEEMLFDHRIDPQENKNLAGNKAYSVDLERMQNKLKEQMEKAESYNNN